MKTDQELYDAYLAAAKIGGTENAHKGLRAVFELGREEGWTHVGERLPEVGVSVIARDVFYGTVGEAWLIRDRGNGTGSFEFAGERKDDCEVTHWRPMPVWTP